MHNVAIRKQNTHSTDNTKQQHMYAASIKRHAHCIKEGIEMEREGGIDIERERFPVTFDVLIVYTAAVILNVAYICDKFNGNSILAQCYWHIICQ